MTITAEELKKALAPITDIEKKERAEVDVLKVAQALVAETSSFVQAEDPLAKLDGLCERVGAIGALLEKAEQDEKGGVFVNVLPADEVAKEFTVEKATPQPPAPAADEKACAPGKKPKKKDEGEGEQESEGGETETQKDEDGLSDDITWERDLAPAKPPTTRSERLTKGERPVPARRGARSHMQKWEEARDRAMGRGGDRCMS